uniref:NADP-dependent oxidoreductase domain-containing protein n=1 Tax=Globodera rostochiensis TaxID=31243 RepID=A0A914ICZ4_GLORO
MMQVANPSSSGGPLIKLNSGYLMPLVGLGTYKLSVDQELVNAAICAALQSGYRQFDTAKLYSNERELGDAFEKSLPKFGLRREDIFLCTKFWALPPDQASVKVPQLVEESLLNLKTSYLDLVLIHYPKPGPPQDENNADAEGNLASRRECWRALEKMPKDKVRSIGVSNYEVRHLEEMDGYASTMPAVNQVEFHPHFRRKDIKAYCDDRGIFFQSFASFARQNSELLNEPTVVELAQKHDTTPQNVLLSFATSQGVGVVPKSTNPQRIHANFECLQLKLSTDDIRKLCSIPERGNYIRNTPWLVL